MRWLPGSLATTSRQPAGSARLDQRNPINRGTAFAWSAQNPAVEMARDLLAATNNTTRQPIANAVAARCSAGQTNVEFLAQPLVTSDSAGTGDFTILILSNPASKAANEHMLAQKNDAGGSPFSQTALIANQNELGTTTPGAVCFFTFNSSDSGVTATGATTGGFHVWVGRRQGSEHSIWRDGVRLNAATRTVRAIIQAGNTRRLAIGSRGNGTTESFAGDAQYAHGWNRALSDAEILQIGASPWKLIEQPARPLWAPAPVATVYRPGSDITANGWTATPSGSLFERINEATLDTGDYITSPNLTNAVTLGWDVSVPTGTNTIRVNARYLSTTGQLRVVMLDSGGSSVGNTAWQALTATDTTYELTVTTTGISTQFRIEVQ